MIYCVVPEALSEELFDKLTEHYKDDPNVEVIVDRRKKERRFRQEGGGRRAKRERRRARASGSFPKVGPEK